jgi:hypothetical protein
MPDRPPVNRDIPPALMIFAENRLPVFGIMPA